MSDRMNRRLKDLSPYVAGRSKEVVAQGHGLDPEKIVKLASNENPYGPSPRAVKAIQESAREVYLYPEDYPSSLIKAISGYIGVPEKMIIPGGNGADEVMDLIFKSLINNEREVVIHPPTFSYYRILTKQYGGKLIEAPLGKGYSFDVDSIIKRINNRTGMVVICSPNNPTGGVIGEEDLRRLLEAGAPVLLDEAYVEFASQSLTPLVKEYENLVVLRTFSKAFGLAGLRVGYGIAEGSFTKELLKIKPPHNVNLLAQKAASASLEDLAHMHFAVSRIKDERARIYDLLKGLKGLEVYPSEGNFLLIKLIDKDAQEILSDLEGKGIIVRGCASFGIPEGIRVSIGKKEENDRFLEHLKALL